MLTEKEKDWAKRQLKKYFGFGMFMTCEDFLAHPWFEDYCERQLKRLKDVVRNVTWSHYWKCAPLDSKFEPFTIYASDCAESYVGRVKNQHIANYLIEVQPVKIDSLINYLEDYRDAAEFEARVVKEALHVTIGDLPCADGPDCKAPHFGKYNTEEKSVGCSMCGLCVARLAVEQEMDV